MLVLTATRVPAEIALAGAEMPLGRHARAHARRARAHRIVSICFTIRCRTYVRGRSHRSVGPFV